MNMDPTFNASFADARPVAQHCAELTWRGPRPEERAEHLSAWCRYLAQDLAQELTQLFSGGKLKVSVAEPEIVTGQKVFDEIGAVALNSLLRCGSDERTMLLSLDYSTAVALTDLSFGGAGQVPDEPPANLPRSAAMLVEQCARLIAQTIAMSDTSSENAQGDVLVRSESVTRLKAFGAEADAALFRVQFSMGPERQ